MSSSASINRPWTFGGRPKTRQVRIKHVQPGHDPKFQPPKTEKTTPLENQDNERLHSPQLKARERTFLSLNLLRPKNKHVTFPRNVEIESSESSSSEDLYKMDTDRSHCLRMTPAMLCEYFRLNGFGQPRVVTSSYGKRQSEAIIIPHPRPFYNLFERDRGTRNVKRVKIQDARIRSLPNVNFNNRNFHLHSNRSAAKQTTTIKNCTSAPRNERVKVQRGYVSNKKSKKVDPSNRETNYPQGNQQRIEAWLNDVAKAKTDSIE